MRIFFSKTPHMCVQNEQCKKGILLSYACRGTRNPQPGPQGPRPPPPTFSEGQNGSGVALSGAALGTPCALQHFPTLPISPARTLNSLHTLSSTPSKPLPFSTVLSNPPQYSTAKGVRGNWRRYWSSGLWQFGQVNSNRTTTLYQGTPAKASGTRPGDGGRTQCSHGHWGVDQCGLWQRDPCCIGATSNMSVDCGYRTPAVSRPLPPQVWMWQQQQQQQQQQNSSSNSSDGYEAWRGLESWGGRSSPTVHNPLPPYTTPWPLHARLPKPLPPLPVQSALRRPPSPTPIRSTCSRTTITDAVGTHRRTNPPDRRPASVTTPLRGARRLWSATSTDCQRTRSSLVNP